MTYPEAAALGIDDLEHGFFVNTQLDPGKQPDKCSGTGGTPTLLAMTPGSPEANALIKLLVDHHVAVTSTLAGVRAERCRCTRRSTARQMDVLTPEAQRSLSVPAQPDRQPRGRRRAASISRRPTRTTSGWSASSSPRAGCCWPGPTRPATAASFPASATSARSSCWSRPASRPWRRSGSRTLNGATYLGLADRIGSIAAGQERRPVHRQGQPRREHRRRRECRSSCSRTASATTARSCSTSVKGRYGQYYSAARVCRASPLRRSAARRCGGRCRPSALRRTAS